MAIFNFPAKRQQLDVRADKRVPLAGAVYLMRKGKPILRAISGDISEHGIFLELKEAHDLQKGKKVQLVIVEGEGSNKQTRQLTGIIIRIRARGVALVTYHKDALRERA